MPERKWVLSGLDCPFVGGRFSTGDTTPHGPERKYLLSKDRSHGCSGRVSGGCRVAGPAGFLRGKKQLTFSYAVA
jgi:hypothetical protein